MDVDAEQANRWLHGNDDAPPDVLGLIACNGSVNQDDEFVSSESRSGVDRAHHRLQALCDLAQQIVACPVSQGVVDELEPIEIDYQQGELVPLARGLSNGLIDAVFQQQAVRQPGKRVVRGEMAQLAVSRFQPLGAIRDDQFETLDMVSERAGVLPFAAQSTRRLQDLNGLEGLLDDDQLVGV